MGIGCNRGIHKMNNMPNASTHRNICKRTHNQTFWDYYMLSLSSKLILSRKVSDFQTMLPRGILWAERTSPWLSKGMYCAIIARISESMYVCITIYIYVTMCACIYIIIQSEITKVPMEKKCTHRYLYIYQYALHTW